MGTRKTDIAIIGGGLSGLTIASLLANKGADFLLLEANWTLGGRIQSIRDPKTNRVLADLGPTWVWPDYQPSILHWVKELKLGLHSQYEDGNGVYEDGSNAPPQHIKFPGQQGIARIVGGPQALVDTLALTINDSLILLESPVTSIFRSNEHYTLRIGNMHGDIVIAKRVVFASPLRLAVEIEGFPTLLPEEVLRTAQSAPTWMATHAKVSAVYKHPFWRDTGLSGRVASRVGPLVEMHDISGETGSPAALFGFSGIPHHQRDRMNMKEAVLNQLMRCFGKEAANPIELEVKDWAKEPFICSTADKTGVISHPERLQDHIRDGYQKETLFFGVSETASDDPGLIAGALHAGSRVAQKLTQLDQH